MSNLKIKRLESFNPEIDVKRFYLPYIFTANCPECGEVVEVNGNEEYVSYPHIGKPTELYFTHETTDENGEWDEHCWEELIVIDLTVKVVE